jgi:hypothetical protein
MHVELAPLRREAVIRSGFGRLGAALGGREQHPGHIGRVERVQIIKLDCQAKEGRGSKRIPNLKSFINYFIFYTNFFSYVMFYEPSLSLQVSFCRCACT